MHRYGRRVRSAGTLTPHTSGSEIHLGHSFTGWKILPHCEIQLREEFGLDHLVSIYFKILYLSKEFWKKGLKYQCNRSRHAERATFGDYYVRQKKEQQPNSGHCLLGNGQFIALFLAWIIIDFLNTTWINMLCAYG